MEINLFFKAVVLCSGIGFVIPVYSDDYNLSGLELVVKSSSNDIERSRLSFGYKNQRREYFWPYVEYVYSDFDWGVRVFKESGVVEGNDYTGRKAEFFIGGRPVPYIYMEGRVGYHDLLSDVLRYKRSMTALEFLGFYEIGRDIKIKGELRRDFLYSSSVGVAAVSDALTEDTRALTGEWQPVLEWRFLARSLLQKTSDLNVKRQKSVEALYGISPEWPWIWSGVFVETLRFDNKTDGYWSPQGLKTFGIKLESSFPLNQRLSATAGFNINRSQDGDEAWGTGYFIGAGIDYLFWGDYHIIFGISRNESLQDESVWKEYSAHVAVRGSL